MSVSEDIRALAREGLATAEIARRLGIRYQHAYKALSARSWDFGQVDERCGNTVAMIDS